MRPGCTWLDDGARRAAHENSAPPRGLSGKLTTRHVPTECTIQQGGCGINESSTTRLDVSYSLYLLKRTNSWYQRDRVSWAGERADE